MIKVISGTCRTSLGLKTPKDNPFTLPPKEEQRLIDRNVAARVFEEEPMEPVATPPVDPKGDGIGVNITDGENGMEGEENAANMDVEQLKTMKLDQLKQLAEDMGINTTGLRSKDDFARAIAAVDVIVDEPELSAEDPVE